MSAATNKVYREDRPRKNQTRLTILLVVHSGPRNQIERTRQRVRTAPRMILILKWVSLIANPHKNLSQKRPPIPSNGQKFVKSSPRTKSAAQDRFRPLEELRKGPSSGFYQQQEIWCTFCRRTILAMPLGKSSHLVKICFEN